MRLKIMIQIKQLRNLVFKVAEATIKYMLAMPF